MKKIILWIFAALILTSMASAELNDSNHVLYLSMDKEYTLFNQAIDTTGKHNGTLVSTVNNASDAVLNTSCGFNTGSSYINMGNLAYTTQTFSFWIDWDAMGSAEWVLSKWGAADPRWGLHLDAANNLEFYRNAGESWVDITPMVNSSFHHVVFFMNATVFKFYFDGRSVLNHTGATPSNANDLMIGGYDDGTNHGGFTGNIDEFALWNRSLTFVEIKELWNNSFGYNPHNPSLTPARTITTTYDSPILEETPNTHYILFKNYNLTNSTNATLVWNGTEYAGSINYSNISWVQFAVNLTSPFVYSNETAYQFYWNTTLAFSNATVENNATGNETQMVSWNLTKYPRVNITAWSRTDGAFITNFTLNDTYKGFYTTSSEIYFWQNDSGGYNISIDPVNHETALANITFTSGSFLHYMFDLYTTNSINFTFLDEETGNQIMNVSIELISDLFAANYSTNTSHLYVDLLSPSLYAMRYNASGYFERFYYFNLTNRTHSNLTLYFLSNLTGSEVTANVYDEGNHLVEDVYIKVLRYDLATNSYIIQEIAKTNFEGQAKLHLILNDEFYQFILEYPFATMRKTTSPTYIFSTTINFQILLGEDIAENFYSTENTIYSLTFNNVTNNFRYTYTDSDSAVQQGCLKVYQMTVLGETLLNSTCVNSATATILIGVNNLTGSTYRADAFLNFGDGEYFVTSLIKHFEALSNMGSLGVMFIILITIVFVFMGAWSYTVALILTPLPVLFGSMMNIIDLSIAITIPLAVVCWIIAILVSRK